MNEYNLLDDFKELAKVYIEETELHPCFVCKHQGTCLDYCEHEFEWRGTKEGEKG